MRHDHLPDGTPVTLYASADELPIERYVRLQQRLILCDAVGSDLPALSARLASWSERAAVGRDAEAAAEAAHLYATLHYLQAGEHLDAYALAVLIAELDGQPCADLSQEGLARTVARLSAHGLTAATCADWLAALKKKVRTDLKGAFPEQFNADADELDFARCFKNALLAQGDVALAPDEAARAAAEARWLHWQNEVFDRCPVLPLQPGHADNPLESLDRWFESVCAALEQHGTASPHQLSTARFYHRVAFLQKQHAPTDAA